MSNVVLPQMIDYYRKENNLTMKQLGEKMDKSESAVSRWIKGTRSPMVDDLDKLSILFSIPVEVLMFGGNANKSSSIEAIYNQLEETRQTKVYNFAEEQLNEQQNAKVVPIVGTTAANPQAISYGDTVYDESVSTNVPDKADAALNIQGDSMEPDFPNSTIVFYRRQPSVENGELAIVEIEDGVTFKKVCFEDGLDVVKLKSLNPKYPDRIIKKSDLKIIGKVVQ